MKVPTNRPVACDTLRLIISHPRQTLESASSVGAARAATEAAFRIGHEVLSSALRKLESRDLMRPQIEPGTTEITIDGQSAGSHAVTSATATRRQFLEFAAAGIAAASISQEAWGDQPKNDIPYRTLGRTGEKVSVVGIGGYHLGRPDVAEDESLRIVRKALDEGINFLDNCWDYNGGESEIRMGRALRDGYRKKAFLMTKIDGRDKNTAEKQLNESLKRLQTDRFDLLQFHEVIRDTDPDRIFAAGGAMEAALQAQKDGKVRYIGFTGHKSPDIHLKMLNTAAAHQFYFDSVQMPLNVMDAHFNSFEAQVLPVLLKQNIGVLGMKPMGDPFILHSKTVTAIECLHYSMNLPTSVVITGCDSLPILQQAIDAARSFQPLGKDTVAKLLAKTAEAAQSGEYEPYKTSHHFDGTFQNPQWLG
jgi:diketogulonate reductase-like aldo/keto reductase